jgi:hypothetical protein
MHRFKNNTDLGRKKALRELTIKTVPWLHIPVQEEEPTGTHDSYRPARIAYTREATFARKDYKFDQARIDSITRDPSKHSSTGQSIMDTHLRLHQEAVRRTMTQNPTGTTPEPNAGVRPRDPRVHHTPEDVKAHLPATPDREQRPAPRLTPDTRSVQPDDALPRMIPSRNEQTSLLPAYSFTSIVSGQRPTNNFCGGRHTHQNHQDWPTHFGSYGWTRSGARDFQQQLRIEYHTAWANSLERKTHSDGKTISGSSSESASRDKSR